MCDRIALLILHEIGFMFLGKLHIALVCLTTTAIASISV